MLIHLHCVGERPTLDSGQYPKVQRFNESFFTLRDLVSEPYTLHHVFEEKSLTRCLAEETHVVFDPDEQRILVLPIVGRVERTNPLAITCSAGYVHEAEYALRFNKWVVYGRLFHAPLNFLIKKYGQRIVMW